MKEDHYKGSGEACRCTDPVLLLATGLGSGRSPVAPGTAGTLVAVPLYLLLAPLPVPLYLALVILACVPAVWVCGRAAERLGREDPPAVVLDEILGYLLTMTAAPGGWPALLAGFLAFRVFDIVKPWPVRWVDAHLRGGAGIVLDDLAAAVYAWCALHLLFYFL